MDKCVVNKNDKIRKWEYLDYWTMLEKQDTEINLDKELAYLYEITSFNYVYNDKDMRDPSYLPESIVLNRNIFDIRKCTLDSLRGIRIEELNTLFNLVCRPIIDGIILIRSLKDGMILYEDTIVFEKINPYIYGNKAILVEWMWELKDKKITSKSV